MSSDGHSALTCRRHKSAADATSKEMPSARMERLLTFVRTHWLGTLNVKIHNDRFLSASYHYGFARLLR